jgi:hypothetical protein
VLPCGKSLRDRDHVVPNFRSLEGIAGQPDILRRNPELGGALDLHLALDHAAEDREFDRLGGVLIQKPGDLRARPPAQGECFAEDCPRRGELCPSPCWRGVP